MSWLTEPRGSHWSTYFILCMLVVVAASLVFFFVNGHNDWYYDNQMYLSMVRGDWVIEAHPYFVTKPFADRILAVFFAQGFSFLLGISYQDAIYFTTIFFLIAFFLLVIFFLFRSEVPLVLALPVMLTPSFYLPIYYIGVFDTISLFFTTVLVYLVAQGRGPQVFTALTALAALLSRSSNFAIVVLLSIKLLASRRLTFAILLLLVIPLSSYLISAYQPSGSRNVHEVNSIAYLILKVGVNSIDNYLGIRLTPTTQSYPCDNTIGPFDLPIVLGNIEAVTACITFKSLTTLLFLALSFGVSGAAIIWLWLYRTKTGLTVFFENHKIELFSLFLFWVLAPTLGYTVSRLFIYATPFLIVVYISLVSSDEYTEWIASSRKRRTSVYIW